MSDAGAAHWDERYRTVGPEAVSWYEDHPSVSLDLLAGLDVTAEQSVVDVGGGASGLVDSLYGSGHRDLTVVDVSPTALDLARQRLGPTAAVTWVAADIRTWTPNRRWDVWHDRAALHFLTEDRDRARYVEVLQQAVRPGGRVVIGVFAEDGPTECSALAVRRHSFAELRELLPTLTVVEERRVDHTTPGKVIQPFNWIAGRLPG